MDKEKPKCYGFFMSGKDCSSCKHLDGCYKLWKINGEPDMVSQTLPMKKEFRLKKCNCN